MIWSIVKKIWFVKIAQDWRTVEMVESNQRTTESFFVTQRNILVSMQVYKFSILAAYKRLCGARKENLFAGHLPQVSLTFLRFTVCDSSLSHNTEHVSNMWKVEQSIAKARETVLRLQLASRASFLVESFVTCQYICRMTVTCDYFNLVC